MNWEKFANQIRSKLQITPGFIFFFIFRSLRSNIFFARYYLRQRQACLNMKPKWHDFAIIDAINWTTRNKELIFSLISSFSHWLLLTKNYIIILDWKLETRNNLHFQLRHCFNSRRWFIQIIVIVYCKQFVFSSPYFFPFDSRFDSVKIISYNSYKKIN